MLTPTIYMSLAVIISSLIILISYMISMKMTYSQEKSSPFECGFDPKASARVPFSTRFFILAVLFLVFDIEIVLLLPTPGLPESGPNTIFIISFFMFVISLGLAHEWREGSLNWSI